MKSRTSIVSDQLPTLKSRQQRSSLSFFESAADPSMSISPLVELPVRSRDYNRRATAISPSQAVNQEKLSSPFVASGLSVAKFEAGQKLYLSLENHHFGRRHEQIGLSAFLSNRPGPKRFDSPIQSIPAGPGSNPSKVNNPRPHSRHNSHRSSLPLRFLRQRPARASIVLAILHAIQIRAALCSRIATRHHSRPRDSPSRHDNPTHHDSRPTRRDSPSRRDSRPTRHGSRPYRRGILRRPCRRGILRRPCRRGTLHRPCRRETLRLPFHHERHHHPRRRESRHLRRAARRHHRAPLAGAPRTTPPTLQF